MYKDCKGKDKECKKDYSCKTPTYCDCVEKKEKYVKCGKSKKSSCNEISDIYPMFVCPIDLCDCQIYTILSNCVGKVVGLKLSDSDCILRLRICNVNACAVMGKTSSGKGPIYIKLNSIQYVDLGRETYVNPLCNSSMGGSQGPAGPAGPKGPKGDKGDMGPSGPKGDKGAKGDIGPAGSKGPKGDMGPAGPKGDKGDMGPVGPKGDKGDIGPSGSKGDKGDMGPSGSKGDKGDVGPSGSKGAKGDMGPVGPKGDKGDIGPSGPVGPAGPKGPKGDKGDKGDMGSANDKPIPPKKIPYKG